VASALLVTSAATLFESAPFILAAALLTGAFLRWDARIGAYLGCGCGVGPSARSLPAAAATCLVFGPIVAGARLAGALLIARIFAAQRRPACSGKQLAPLEDLRLIVPVALLSAAGSMLLPLLAGARIAALPAAAVGAFAAFLIAPCALGSVALAASLRAYAPAAAAGFLCVAGIIDIRAWLRAPDRAGAHDALSYAILAAACAIVAMHRGGALVHPILAVLLWPCAAAAAAAAVRFRDESCGRLRIGPLVMFAGAVLAAPPAQYHATETTLADAFPGERVDFTGELTRTGSAATLVRYAITCCRADAAPVVVRLLRSPANVRGWIRARGVLVQRSGTLALDASSLVAIPPPADPFVYR